MFVEPSGGCLPHLRLKLIQINWTQGKDMDKV